MNGPVQTQAVNQPPAYSTCVQTEAANQPIQDAQPQHVIVVVPEAAQTQTINAVAVQAPVKSDANPAHNDVMHKQCNQHAQPQVVPDDASGNCPFRFSLSLSDTLTLIF